MTTLFAAAAWWESNIFMELFVSAGPRS